MYLPSLKKVLYALAKAGKAVSQPLNNVATKVTSASSFSNFSDGVDVCVQPHLETLAECECWFGLNVHTQLLAQFLPVPATLYSTSDSECIIM